jgi:hypothetical protein
LLVVLVFSGFCGAVVWYLYVLGREMLRPFLDVSDDGGGRLRGAAARYNPVERSGEKKLPNVTPSEAHTPPASSSAGGRRR